MSKKSAVRWLSKSPIGKVGKKVVAYLLRPQIYYPHADLGAEGNVKVGEGTILYPRVLIDGSGEVVIGDHCIISDGAKIYSHSHLFLEGYVEDITAEERVKTWNITIGDNVFVGEEAMILPQAKEIGSSAIIGTRAVVTKQVGPGEIWAGNPARKIGERSSLGDVDDLVEALTSLEESSAT